MRRLNIAAITAFAIAFVFLFYILSRADENITITTYYPSPYGSYNELTTASNTTLATSGGNVGIGTVAPAKKLEVKGGDIYINQTNGKLIIKSPDGSCSSCGVDNSDAWSCASLAPCP